MFELLIGIDGVQRRTGERVEKVQRGDEGERRSRLRTVVAAIGRRPAADRAARRGVFAPRPGSVTDCR